MPPLVLTVDDCRAAYERCAPAAWSSRRSRSERYGSVDAGFRDPSGNGWKMIQGKRKAFH